MRSPDLLYLSTGQLARTLGVPAWRVARLFELSIVPEPPRLGRQRAIPRTLIPAVVDALRRRGWQTATAKNDLAEAVRVPTELEQLGGKVWLPAREPTTPKKRFRPRGWSAKTRAKREGWSHAT